MTLKIDGWPGETIGHLFHTRSSFVHHLELSVKSNLSHSPETLNSGQIGDFFLSRVTLKFDGWPWKTIGHLFYTTISFVHHLKAIGIFKLELQSGILQFRSELAIFFLLSVTFKFDGGPWKTIGHLFYTTLSFVQHFKAIGIFKLELQPRNAQFGSKLAIFCHAWPWKLTDDLKKTIGHLSFCFDNYLIKITSSASSATTEHFLFTQNTTVEQTRSQWLLNVIIEF